MDDDDVDDDMGDGVDYLMTYNRYPLNSYYKMNKYYVCVLINKSRYLPYF